MSNPTPAQRAASLEAAGLARNGRVLPIMSDSRYERSPDPTPEERAAADAVSRLGQQHPTERWPELTAVEQTLVDALADGWDVVIGDRAARDVVAKVRPLIADETLRGAAAALDKQAATVTERGGLTLGIEWAAATMRDWAELSELERGDTDAR